MTIDSASDRLNHLVANLLDASRIQTGAIIVDRETCAVEELVGQAVSGFSQQDAEIDLPENLALVDTDPFLMGRVLENLLSNALRYAPTGSKVQLRARNGGDIVDLDIRDHGPGINSVDLDRIFLPFERLGDRSPDGSGLGQPLPMVSARRLAHRSRLDHAGWGTNHDRSIAAGAISRLLVVDDDPQLLRALSINLRARDYEVFTAWTGAGALQVAAAEVPDLVILDLGLPDLDGLDVVKGLRGWSEVPIVVLSARGEQRQKVRALDAGADDYITKPFGMSELLARLRAALRRSPNDSELPVVESRDFTIDRAARVVTRDGKPVRLTPTEWHILDILLRHSGNLVSQKQLCTTYGDRRTRRNPTIYASTWHN